jgi:hypothetical protein
MIKIKCGHEWKLYTDVGINASIPATYKCEKCTVIMTAPEVHQLEALQNQNETLKHLKGFQAYVAGIALLISFLALMVSILN